MSGQYEEIQEGYYPVLERGKNILNKQTVYLGAGVGSPLLPRKSHTIRQDQDWKAEKAPFEKTVQKKASESESKVGDKGTDASRESKGKKREKESSNGERFMHDSGQ